MLSWVVLKFLLAVLIRHCIAEGHFQNVALHKSCNQSSYLKANRHECGAAINGDTSGRYDVGPNCIHTNISDWDPFWQVDLGQSYPIHHIVVFGRTEADTLVRMSGCQIKVDDNLCYTIGNVSRNDSQRFDIICSPPRSGQVIRVEKHASPSTLIQEDWKFHYYINMCEVQVYVCSDGYWGSGCDNTCGQCSSGHACDKQTGDCTNGCASGFFPPKCTVSVVNGQWGSWGSYGACSVTCGGGSQSRSRQCNNPAPAYGGANCSGASTETVQCNTQGCPVNGQWGSWGGYGICSVTCGGGSQTKTRQCDNPAPAHGGAACPGASTETAHCNNQGCPVNGQWGSWGGYGICSVTCGGGSQTKTRQCDNPAPAHGGANCSGASTDTAQCNNQGCPVNGQWGEWLLWGTCSVTCGGGSQTRSRQCDNPAPAHGGAACSGSNMETRTCDTLLCPVNGQWGSWGDDGPCSVTCGRGSLTRNRQCDNPAPAHGGSYCPGNSIETRACIVSVYPANGQWGEWQSWGTCSVTCGGGSQSRSRQFDNPPDGGVNGCPGNETESQDCNGLPCECEDGHYGQACNEICGHCDGGQPCYKTNGQCQVCSPGYLPPDCKQPCADDRYGQNCEGECGHCANKAVCDKSDGTCPLFAGLTRCESSFKPPFCQAHDEAESQSKSQDTWSSVGPIVGAILGCGVMITVGVIVTLCWMKRRRSSSNGGVHSTRGDSAVGTQERNKNTVEMDQIPSTGRSCEPASLPEVVPRVQSEIYEVIRDSYHSLHPYVNDFNPDRDVYTHIQEHQTVCLREKLCPQK